MAGYLKAWASDEPGDIIEIFEPDAHYFTAPHRPAHAGHDAIVSMWVGRRNSTLNWTFESTVVATEGDLFVIRDVTTYPDGIDNPGEEVYDNLWIVTLADSGRASEFIEYWMLRD